MKTTRNLLCLLMLSAAIVGPGVATAADDPATSSSVPAATDSGTDSSTDTAPLALDPEQIQALQDAADGTDEDKSTFEKASDFVTDNAPWFIIGIIVLAAIVAGILIMRGRPRKAKAAKASRGAAPVPGQPAEVPSASELRRRKRAAIQRSREEERMRRKTGIEGRRAVRQGGIPAAPVAGTAAVMASGAIDPIEAEKQAARDQETAAAAVARFGGAVPAPRAPSQTAPAAGVVTPDAAGVPVSPSVPPVAPEPDTIFEPAPSAPFAEPAAPMPEVPEAETSILHEPALEAPGPDAAVGDAAQAFLAGGAAGAAGGLAAARVGQPDEVRPEAEAPLEPVIAPEPGMAPEHALAVEPDAVPAAPEPETVPEPDSAAAAAEERLRAKVAEIKATQEPAAPPVPEPGPLGPNAELSPGLAAVERKLSENSEERDRALRDAEERLRRVEQRAEDAERRAAFAERLAQLKVEESERERRLNDVVSGIDRAEQRAREAEARAESAERAAAAALEQSDLKAPEPSPPPPAEQTVSPEPPAVVPADPPTPARKGLFGEDSPTQTSASSSDAINLNSATFEELREAGLSVTQATRILAYRERFGGYGAVEDLEKVPGFPADLIESLRGRVTI